MNAVPASLATLFIGITFGTVMTMTEDIPLTIGITLFLLCIFALGYCARGKTPEGEHE